MANPDVARTPLVLLVGFLGAGKTTLLKRLIGEARAQWLSPHVILNDYANARVDADALKAELSSIIPISGSCVCCSSQYELLAALAEHKHQDRGVMFLEANGTTDAATLLMMLAASTKLGGFTRPLQLSVIDAKRWGKRWHGNNLESHQVKTASHVYLSRRDEVSSSRLNDVQKAVAQTNPKAAVVEPGPFVSSVAALASTVASAPQFERVAPAAAHNHEAHHFATLSLPIPGPVGRDAFLRFLAQLPTSVVRAKGVVEFVETPGEKRMFQKVEADAEISPYPLKQQAAAPLLVMVGPALPESALREALQALMSS